MPPKKNTLYEFPVRKKIKYDHDQIKDRQESFVMYKILAVPNQNSYEFFALKYISNQQYSSLSQSKLNEFTGNIYMMNEKGRKLSARHYENGKFSGDLIPVNQKNSQKLPDSKQRLSVECYTETTYYWTDWYQYGEYIGSTLDYVTQEEYCESSGGGSGGPSGDGGGGSSTTYHEHTDSTMPSHYLSMNPVSSIRKIQIMKRNTPN